MRIPTPPAAAFLLALSLTAAGCAIPAYVRDSAPWVEAADWSKAEKVRLALTEYTFDPQVLTFQEGHAYVLELTNTGRETHDFASDKFPRAVATRKARVPGVAELEAPHFTSIELEPGGVVEFSFVAVRPGTYEMVCTHPGHKDKGMIGAIRILPATAPR